MRLNARTVAATVGALIQFVGSSALAHVGIRDTGVAGADQVITFNVSHGCSGADTVSVEVQIPSGVTSVRGVPSFFGYADVITDDADQVTSVVWTKADNRPSDDQFYQLQLRIHVPDLPFQALYFPVLQHCRAADGTESTTEWVGTPTHEAEEPAAVLRIVPPRMAGWNKYTVPVAVDDAALLPELFGDAQIVWAGDRAYSANEATAAMIEAEEGVSTLETISAGTEIWVKY